MGNRSRSAIVVGILAPALACTAVTGLGKSYDYTDDGAAANGDASTSDSASGGRDGSKNDGDKPGTACPPLVGGAYAMTNEGDCGGTYDKSAKECVSTTTSVVNGNCSLQFSSPGAGVNGTLDAQSDGNFKNGLLVVGAIHRAGCVAIFNPVPPTLIVSCPTEAGAGGNTCVITMTRTVATCL